MERGGLFYPVYWVDVALFVGEDVFEDVGRSERCTSAARGRATSSLKSDRGTWDEEQEGGSRVVEC